MLGDVRPNAAHQTAAGTVLLVEYHGNAKHMRCMNCSGMQVLEIAHRTERAPRCGCGGVMKPDVVLFGDRIPEHAVVAADDATQQADVVIIVGTSATVYPAAEIPVTAKRHGAFIVECNLEPTDFTSFITDAFLQGKAGTTLPALAEAVARLL
jgi:NAD-dependent deacetylase